MTLAFTIARIPRRTGLDRFGHFSANTNTSLNETLDSKQVAKLSRDVAKALGKIAGEHPDSVGVAFAVNGTIEEVNLYPGHTLFAKVYPRLLESYAVEAALQKGADDETDPQASQAPPTIEAVQAFLTAKPGERIRQDKINDDNRLDVYWAEGRATCVTKYNGAPLHRQWLRADKPADPAQDELQNRFRQQLNQDPELYNNGPFRQEQQQRGSDTESNRANTNDADQ